METLTDPPGANNTSEQLGSNAVLDQIEAEALGMNPGAGQPGADQQPGSQGEPEAKPKSEQPQPSAAEMEQAYIVTSQVAATGCKFACKKLKFVFGQKPDNISDERWEIVKERTVAVFDRPLFQEIVVPVLKKYNITIFNIPPEVTMIGGIVYLVMEMKEALANEIAAAQKE